MSEQHLLFKLISSLWKEREHLEFVSRDELRQELLERAPTGEDEVLTEWNRNSINLALDAFAFHGYDERGFFGRLNEDADLLPDQPGFFWRYRIMRDGVTGYVRKEDLTAVEREHILHRLAYEADEAQRKAYRLQRIARRIAGAGA
jgi:hypothetical protein